MYLSFALFNCVFFLLSIVSNVKANIGIDSLQQTQLKNEKICESIIVTDESKNLERQAIFLAYLNAIDVENPDAALVIEELQNSLYLAEPISYSGGNMFVIRTLEEINGFKFIPVVTLLSSDENLGSAWKEAAGRPGATFALDPPMLILGREKFSKFWGGISLLHQGRQISAFVWQEFDIDDPFKIKVAQEFYANELIFEVLRQRGGKIYNKILLEKVKAIKDSFLKNNVYLPPDFTESVKLDSAFDEAPLSPAEVLYRWQTLWLHATFVAIEELNANSSDEVEMAKIRYLEKLLK